MESASEQGESGQRVGEMEVSDEVRNLAPYEWHIDGWAAKSKAARDGDCREIFSDAFYSHENGYRMCLSVSPDGYDLDKGTHLSAYFYLLRGPHDDTLSWPFRRAVTLSIVDQRTGAAHASRSFSFDKFPNNASWNRPSTHRNGGFGTYKLVELAALASAPGLCLADRVVIKCVLK